MQTRFGAFLLDTDRRVLEREGRPVHLTGKAFSLLEMLVTERPRAVSKRELVDRLWPDVTVAAENLKNLISEIRDAIDDGAGASRIRTVHGFGYAFAPDTPHNRCWIQYKMHAIAIRAGVSDVGRDPACAICIDAPGVSRHHARITVTDESVVLEDLGSKNGTRVGRVRISGTVPLHDGDRISLGSVALTFRSGEATDSTVTEASESTPR